MGANMKHLRRLIANFVALFISERRTAKRVKNTIKKGIFKRLCDVYRYRRDENTDGIKYNLGIVAIMKNEGPYLQEWIEFHRLMGVEKFYLYDNESTDDTKSILAPYIESGVVEYTYFPGQKMQLPAYWDCVNKYKNETKWLAIIDLDEYIVPVKYDSVAEFLAKQKKRVAQVVIPWVIFGSGGHEQRPNGLVLESYTKCAKRNWLYKSIVNPRMIIDMGCHEQMVAGATRDIKDSELRINHYHCKSWAEYQLKASRGDAWFGADAGIKKYQRNMFKIHDLNDITDDTVLRFMPRLKRAMGI